jgi:hypothetical protein
VRSSKQEVETEVVVELQLCSVCDKELDDSEYDLCDICEEIYYEWDY